MFNFFLYYLVIIFLSGIFLFAQEKNEPIPLEVEKPSPIEQDTVLPKIDLPEFFITGNEQIDIPFSSKSENDEDKIYVSQNTFSEKRIATVPTDISSKLFKTLPNNFQWFNGKILASFGNYTTPALEGWFGSVGKNGNIVLHADYSSSKGHILNAGWKKYGIDIAGNYSLDDNDFLKDAVLHGDVGFSGRNYKAYASILPSQNRTLNAFALHFGISSQYEERNLVNNDMHYATTISWHRFSFHDSSNSVENDYGISAKISTQIKDYFLEANTEYITSAFSMPTFLYPLHTPQWFVIRALGKTQLSSAWQISLMAQQFLYRGTISAFSGRFFPQIEVRYTMDAITLFSGFYPTMERISLSKLTENNQYIFNNQILQPTEIPINISIGSDMAISPQLFIKGTVTYKSINNFPVFVDTSNIKLWEVQYFSSISQISLDLQSSFQITPQNSLMISGNVIRSRNTEKYVPYIPFYIIDVSYKHKFNFGLGIEIYVEYISQRWADLENIKKINSYSYIGIRNDYEIIDRLHGILEIKNLLHTQYYKWIDYKERGLFVSLGLSYIL